MGPYNMKEIAYSRVMGDGDSNGVASGEEESSG